MQKFKFFSARLFVPVLLIGGVFLTYVLLTPHQNTSPQEFYLQEHKYYGSSSLEIVIPKYECAPVSVVDASDDKYILCDYTKILLFNNKNNTITQIAPSEDTRVVNPAGLFYDQEKNLLYVANYKQKNVLVFNFDKTTDKLTFKEEIKNDLFKGPEGVFVSNKQLYIADYDGSLIFCYNLSGNKPYEVWHTPIKLAHSIIRNNDHIFAASLGDSKIYKLDLQGKIIGATSGLGNKSPYHLWPTHLFRTHENNLGVVDPHQGSISKYDLNLNPLSVFGKNGPAPDFNFPYTVNTIKTGYVMANTFGQNLIYFDKNLKVVKTVKLGKISKLSPPSPVEVVGDSSTLPERVYPYKDDSQMFFKAIGLNNILNIYKTYPSYNGFLEVEGTTYKKLIRMDSSHSLGLFSPGHFYMTFATKLNYKGETFYIVHGPQTATVLVVDPVTYAPQFIATGCYDLWGKQIEQILREKHSMDLDKFIALRKKISAGAPRAQAYEEIILNQWTPEQKKNLWSKVLSYAQNNDKLSTTLLTKYTGEDIAEYVSAIKQRPEIYLPEILFVNYLIGYSIFNPFLDSTLIPDMKEAHPQNLKDARVLINNTESKIRECLTYDLSEVIKINRIISDTCDYNVNSHCGHFVRFLASILENKGYKTIVYDIQNNLGTIHAILEVFDLNGNFLATLDPTLGVAYKTNLEFFIKNKGHIVPGIVFDNPSLDPKFYPYYLDEMAKHEIVIRKKFDNFNEL